MEREFKKQYIQFLLKYFMRKFKKRLEVETDIELTGYINPHHPLRQQRKAMR